MNPVTLDDRTDDGTVRRRPKDRRARIADASAMAFSEFGYHAVTMEDIASRVGISAPALYRHYAGKYDLFRDVVLDLGQQLADAARTDDAGADDEPESVLRTVLEALAEVAIKNRTAGGVFRWQAQHLYEDDLVVLAAQFKSIHRAMQNPLRAIRPGLTSTQRWILSTAMLSIIGSITDHHTSASDNDIKALVTDICSTVMTVTPPISDGAAASAPAGTVAAPGFAVVEYEEILRAALKLFYANGFHLTTVDRIASASGVSRVAIYRSFESKKSILGAVFRRAADRVSARTAEVITRAADPSAAARGLVADYVDAFFEQPELAYVYYADRANLTSVDLKFVTVVQHSTIDAWVQVVRAARPGLNATAAKFSVHAAFSLVVDIARLIGLDSSEYSRTCIGELMEATLLAG